MTKAADSASQIRDFLMSRRAKVQPEDVGLPRGRRRRVAGLRREEVAALAGVSIDYYVQIERGDVAGVSDEVLGAVCRGLLLDPAETRYLFNLARGARPTPDGRTSHAPVVAATTRVHGSLQALLDAITTAPAVLQNPALDIIAANRLGWALYDRAGADAPPGEALNLARYVYLGDDSHRFYDDWNAIADDVAAMLRTAVARYPADRRLARLLGELNTGSRAFRQRWQAMDVRDHHRGAKTVHHHEVGTLHLRYDVLDVTDHTGLRLFAYTPDPDHPETPQALRLLETLGHSATAPASAGR